MDYEELGFKCGIEIHQQLNTETKLFCRCPVDLEDEAPDAKVQRRLRSVAGETGEQDEAAEVESMKKRKFMYHYHDRNNCLVELDEEPPHKMSQEALNTALTFARMVDASIPREIQVMRKMVVDGSNTSGFQRTSMVGLDGELETESGKVAIEDIELEEESAGINDRSEKKAVYDLSRLGVPLIEVGTDASIKDPDHAREVAEEIGMLLRSTGKARRGIGTIRQDVNVSIDGGARVEIKGFQDVRNIDTLIENEVERQKNLIELGDELEEEASEVVGDNVTHLFEDSENQIISTVLENDGAVYGFKFPGLAGRMKEKISGDRYLALELVDYAKTRGIQGILHTDEDRDYGIQEEFEELRDIFKASEDDVIAVLAGPEDKAREAAKAVRDRAEKFYTGEVPEETRNAEQDFTTSYSRPLPGAARMYPETDIPPIKISDEKIEEVDENLPRTLDEREKEYTEEIGEELATQIVSSELLPLFEAFKDDFDAKLVANVFTNIYSKLESENVPVDKLEKRHYRSLFEAFDRDEVAKGDFEEVLTEMAENPSSPEEAVEEVVSGKASEDEIREVVQEVIDQKQEMIEEQGEHAQGALMGLVMERVEADGGTVSRILGEELQDYL
ncbi:Glu-tRNA(Gln) amidotransferase subunit GatE [Candidatus Nanosalina sp. VS9-1]|uniref:Glu-tRNA(Gln) amidotransferase subunit GatE n=1 Tax=Candidatus Nanosalina sp. VS9-1 TaxID=3388566 RepID=UPI0039DF7A1E